MDLVLIKYIQTNDERNDRIHIQRNKPIVNILGDIARIIGHPNTEAQHSVCKIIRNGQPSCKRISGCRHRHHLNVLSHSSDGINQLRGYDNILAHVKRQINIAG